MKHATKALAAAAALVLVLLVPRRRRARRVPRRRCRCLSRRSSPIQVTGPAVPAAEPDHHGRRLPVGSAEHLPRRPRPEPLGHVGHGAVPHLPQLHQRLRGRARLDRLRHPLRPGRPRARRRRHDPRHRRPRGPDQHQEHRAAHDTSRAAAPTRSRAARSTARAPVGCNAADARQVLPARARPTRARPAPRRTTGSSTTTSPRSSASRARRRTCRRWRSSTPSPTAASAARQATTSGGSPQGPLISLHELGHSLGTLADEYPYSSRDVIRPCYTGGEPSSFHHTIMTARRRCSRRRRSGGAGSARRASPAASSAPTRAAALYPCGQRRPSRALDDALDRLRLRPDRPRAHGRPRHRHAQLRPDERAEHADHRHGGQGLGRCGSRPATRASTS